MWQITYQHQNQTKQLQTQELTQKQLKALNNKHRQKIIQKLSQKPNYPAKIAKELQISKQKCHYHFKKLQEAQLVEKTQQENIKGGTATKYQPTNPSYTYIPNKNKGKQHQQLKNNQKIQNFLKPLITENKKLNGHIVTGSPDKHGEDQVRSRDNHLAGEIMHKIGNYTQTTLKDTVKLDTQINNSQKYEQNMLLLGGILTNTVSRKYNQKFPAHFNEDQFPYREIQTPQNQYTDENTGIITKTRHPENRHHRLFMIAGVSHRGTKAATLAFKDLEKTLKNYQSQEQYYIIVEGLDIDGDGELDDYKVIEKTQ